MTARNSACSSRYSAARHTKFASSPTTEYTGFFAVTVNTALATIKTARIQNAITRRLRTPLSVSRCRPAVARAHDVAAFFYDVTLSLSKGEPLPLRLEHMTAVRRLIALGDVHGILLPVDAAEIGGDPVGALVGRRSDAGLGRHQQPVLGVDERTAAVVGHLEARSQHDGIGRARLLAEPAEDAAQLVDLVPRGVALARRAAVL